jgi:hypothetical protein
MIRDPNMRATPYRSIGRWIVGGVVFVAAAGVLFEAAGQALSRPPAVAKGYQPVAVADQDVQTAVQVALNDQKARNRRALKLLSVLAAERQVSSGDNFRLCLSLDRRGRTDTARVVVHRTPKGQWSVTLWAWGACRS